MPVEISHRVGDLLEIQADALVNPWNRNVIPRWLLVPGGVSGALKKVTGPEPWRELARSGVLQLGEAVATSAGTLETVREIIHVAGLTLAWRATEHSVRLSTRNAAVLAARHGHQVLTVPLIGSGHGALTPNRSRQLIRAALQEAPVVQRLQVIIVEPATRHQEHGATGSEDADR